MFDTMTLTKAGGALCGALLIFLLGNWAASSLYGSGEGHGGEEHAATGYVLAAAESEAAPEEEAEAVPFSEILASADAEKGAKLFSKCKSCHKLEEGANGTGPTLYGVVNRHIGSVAGFSYSDAVAAKSDETWTTDALNEWLISPKNYIPGNKMSFKGLKKETDRANLIAYLATIGG